MKTIVFYSYKGGTGRTLLLANYAKYLTLCNKKVVVLDFDLEAPGLHYKFKDSFIYSVEASNISTGLVKYLLLFQADYVASRELETEYIKELSFGNVGKCYFLPAGNAPSRQYASDVLSLNWKKFFPARITNRGVPFFIHLKEIINLSFKPDFLLIDSRTGITDIGSVATKCLADFFVCLFLNNPENIDGIKLMLDSINALPNNKIITIPILSRIIKSSRLYENDLVTCIKRKLALSEDDELFVLHNDPEIQIAEKLLIGSEKALFESIGLRDYFKIFFAIDKETAEKSKFFSINKYLEDYDRRYSDSEIQMPSPYSSVLKRIGNRENKEINITKYAYVAGDYYSSFINEINKEIKSALYNKFKINFIINPISEDKINWDLDLLGIQMRIDIFDFCTEPYYLTAYRALTTDIIQFGVVETFTAFVKKEVLLNTYINNFNASFEDRISKAKKSLNKPLDVGMMSETAAAFEAAHRISHIVSGNNLFFLKDPKILWKWIKKCPENRMIICDHSTARKVADISKNNEYIFAKNSEDNNKHLIFKYSENVPVGFLYPIEDKDWRYFINQAIANVIITRKYFTKSDNNKYSLVAKNLWESGIKILSEEQIIKNLIWGMNSDDAVIFSNKYESLKSY